MSMIDFHTHCFPDALAERAIGLLAERSERKPFYDGTAGGLTAYMRGNGIDKAVVCNIATNAKQTAKVNDFAISLKGYENLIPFGSIHPGFREYKAEIGRLKAAGIRGLKFHPDYQEYFADDPAMTAVCEYAAGLGMILLFHTGLDIGLRGVVRCTPDRLINVVKALPGATIVAAHMGGYKYADITEDYLIGENLYFDTSNTLTLLPKRQAERMIKNHGADKILFATDGPWFDAKKDIRYIDGLNLTAGEKDAIFHKNAERLLEN
jgi:predicted TIM-barrel fold metal-dependent hydrolase